MFDTLSDRLSATFKNLRGKGKLSDADIDATAREIRIALLEADVNLAVVKEFIAAVKERAKGEEVSQALNPSQQIIKIVNEELVNILGGDTRNVRFAKKPPTVIMLAGLQGAGKTTLAGKLAYWLKSEGHSPLLVAADLQRPNAVTQLQVVGQRAGVHVFAPHPGASSAAEAANPGGVGDPVAVARDALVEADRKLYDVVIVDTAGRLGVDEVLMQQAADIKAAVNPDEVLFVVDAMIGQDAVNTAQAFADGVGYDGVVLTKLDGDARGGAALSIARVIGKPIMFASSGEQMKDFDVFHPERMASRILGMGDMLTLIEQAEKTFDEEQSRKAAEKISSKGGSQFGLGDFLEQMKAVRRMGPLSKIFGMLPGMGEMKDQIANIDEREVDRLEAIILSMTPAERDDPKILNGSRRARIAKGSGTEVSEVNQLVERFFEARKMMSALANGQMPSGMPGMPGMPGAGGGKKKQQQTKKGKNRKGVSGNPAKRNAPVMPEPPQPAADPAAAFGGHGFDMGQFKGNGAGSGSEFELPPELQKMFNNDKNDKNDKKD
ncbi:signal recognition particle protein [Enemella evansiae]|uniref:signal recognition particle protein n=1 Tax=Enemella evansiae TaxID=2016499 RepID=UPI000B96C674|nr:signal recognition particle protein [Enemella evansiae]OYO20159.1 signal recognition particle protein [Enemella evansiae]TDO92627.1 signal recognition particle subunit FFH/SRP54 (srp54) [Enemella evansiae]